uniref:Putative secreted protein n=1 Tax=Rhipicephalus microplus TaxID=6941 RepID=A0A6M2DEJ9_RHIMP
MFCFFFFFFYVLLGEDVYSCFFTISVKAISQLVNSNTIDKLLPSCRIQKPPIIHKIDEWPVNDCSCIGA